jgi:hypothetical protein
MLKIDLRIKYSGVVERILMTQLSNASKSLSDAPRTRCYDELVHGYPQTVFLILEALKKGA